MSWREREKQQQQNEKRRVSVLFWSGCLVYGWLASRMWLAGLHFHKMWEQKKNKNKIMFKCVFQHDAVRRTHRSSSPKKSINKTDIDLKAIASRYASNDVPYRFVRFAIVSKHQFAVWCVSFARTRMSFSIDAVVFLRLILGSLL